VPVGRAPLAKSVAGRAVLAFVDVPAAAQRALEGGGNRQVERKGLAAVARGGLEESDLLAGVCLLLLLAVLALVVLAGLAFLRPSKVAIREEALEEGLELGHLLAQIPPHAGVVRHVRREEVGLVAQRVPTRKVPAVISNPSRDHQ
jgi:hypothetical protein